MTIAVRQALSDRLHENQLRVLGVRSPFESLVLSEGTNESTTASEIQTPQLGICSSSRCSQSQTDPVPQNAAMNVGQDIEMVGIMTCNS